MTRPDLHTQNKLLASLKCEVKLPKDLGSLQSEYRNAKPYPHLVLDNLFSRRHSRGFWRRCQIGTARLSSIRGKTI
jgi:hypothetical protein